MKKRVILDVNAGADIAAAILFSSSTQFFEIVGITSVWGFYSVGVATKQAALLENMLDFKIPIYRGCPESMVRRLYHKQQPIGLIDSNYQFNRNYDFISSNKIDDSITINQPEPTHAVTFLINALREASSPLTIVTTGPLTNLGCAIRIAPDIIENIDEIILTGGGVCKTDATMWAEANLWCDPEAAEILLNSKAKITMVPLDATSEAVVNKNEFLNSLDKVTIMSSVFEKILEKRSLEYENAPGPGEKNFLSFPSLLSIIYLIKPEVFKELRHVYIQVSLDHGYSGGAIRVGEENLECGRNVFLAYAVNQDIFTETILGLLKNFKSC